MCLTVEDWRVIPIPIAQLSWWTRTSKRAYHYPSARAGAAGAFQSTLRRESSWDGGFANGKAQSEMPNLHPNFAKCIQNASNCGVSIMKGIVLWNSITCKGER
jgi:hypothetical protein